MKTNYHSHSHLCDGREPLESYVKSAIEQGMVAWGFSGHSPVPCKSTWNMKSENLPIYLSETKRLKEKYANEIQLYIGMEIDFIEGLVSLTDFADCELDYTIGAIHFLKQLPNGDYWDYDGSKSFFQQGVDEIFGGNIQQTVAYYYEQIIQLVETQKPDILAHFDLIGKFNKDNYFFNENDKWYRNLAYNALQAISKTETLLEINTRSVFRGLLPKFHPALYLLKSAKELGIKIILSSDAHHPREVNSLLKEAAEFAKAAGYKSAVQLFNNSWEEIAL